MKNEVYISTDTRTGAVRLFRTLAEAAAEYGGSHQGVQQAVAYGRTTFGCTWKKGPRFFAVKTRDKEYLLCTRKDGMFLPLSRHEKIKEADAAAVKDVSLSMYMQLWIRVNS